MTGEVSLRGGVMPIGGLPEKLMAAQRAGITTVFIPKENERPSVQVCGLTITVLEIEDQRLSRLLIVKNDPRKTPEEETHED